MCVSRQILLFMVWMERGSATTSINAFREKSNEESIKISGLGGAEAGAGKPGEFPEKRLTSGKNMIQYPGKCDDGAKRAVPTQSEGGG